MSEGLVCIRVPSGENHCPILKVVLSVKHTSASVGPIWLAETMALLGRLRDSDCSVIPTTSSGEKKIIKSDLIMIIIILLKYIIILQDDHCD